jgi:hypothetical protein
VVDLLSIHEAIFVANIGKYRSSLLGASVRFIAVVETFTRIMLTFS